MERSRRVAIAAVGVVMTLLTAGLVLRVAGKGGDGRLAADARPTSIDGLSAEVRDDQPATDIQPGEPPQPSGPAVPGGLPGEPTPTLPTPGAATIPLPDFNGQTTGPSGSGTPSSATTAPAFTQRGVWVVKADGTSPSLVAKDATAGVASGGTWVAFVEGGTARAVRRSDLRTKVDLGSGVSGTAAQGVPIAGGQRGVAFLREGRAVLVDPAVPGQPLASFEAQTADAVAAEVDGEGRLVWGDATGLHVGAPERITPSVRVQRGVLVMGHGALAHLEDGQVAIDNGPRLSWGSVDRLSTGAAGIVAGSGGRVRLRTQAGEDRVLLDRASTPVLAGNRILYVSSSRSIYSATLTGTDVRSVATAASDRSITNLDLLDDSTLVVTVA